LPVVAGRTGGKRHTKKEKCCDTGPILFHLNLPPR
jgi:hypothetical protein